MPPAFQAEADVAAAYDEVAADYTRLLADALASDPIDRAQLSAFLELAAPADGAPRLADLGCGPGRITGWLVARGAEVVGVDLSPGMVAVARQALPGVRFEVGSLLAPPLAGLAPFDGLLAWYSLIHVDPADHPRAMATFARLLRPAGALVLAFQIGADADVRPERPYGHAVDLRPIRLDPDRVTRDLRAAGFTLLTRTDREPDLQPGVRQCYLLARAPGPDAR